MEILYIAKRLNLEIIEVPVKWNNVKDSKVKLKKDILRTLWELFKIKMYIWKGYYNA